MELVEILLKDADRIAPLVAAFRVQLKSYKGIIAQPNIEAGKEEIIEFLNSGFPVYAVADDGALVGYIVCRVDEPCLWVEHIYVRKDFRRKGAATMLFRKAEEIAASMGEDTVSVLNMIEIRRPYKGEKLTTTIHVDAEAFDY